MRVNIKKMVYRANKGKKKPEGASSRIAKFRVHNLQGLSFKSEPCEGVPLSKIYLPARANCPMEQKTPARKELKGSLSRTSIWAYTIWATRVSRLKMMRPSSILSFGCVYCWYSLYMRVEALLIMGTSSPNSEEFTPSSFSTCFINYLYFNNS